MVALQWQLRQYDDYLYSYPWMSRILANFPGKHARDCASQCINVVVIDSNCRRVGALEFWLWHENRKSKVHYNSSFLIKLRIIIPPILDHGCATTLQKSSERSRVSAVFRDSQQSQDFAMSSLILPRVSRPTCRLHKKTAANNNQMSCLSDIFSNPRRRLVQEFACILSSQPTGGCSSS